MKPSLIALLAVTVLASAVGAHTPLASSTPADKASVAAPVKEIGLKFSDEVRLTAVVLADASGGAKALGELPDDIAADFVVAVRDELAPGAYVATWRAVGADTHVITGEIHFTVTAPTSH